MLRMKEEDQERLNECAQRTFAAINDAVANMLEEVGKNTNPDEYMRLFFEVFIDYHARLFSAARKLSYMLALRLRTEDEA